jgi:hypothetical protein
MDPDVGELLRYLPLLVKGEGDARRLFPVPQGGVENSDLLACVVRGEENNTPQPSFSGTWLRSVRSSYKKVARERRRLAGNDMFNRRVFQS